MFEILATCLILLALAAIAWKIAAFVALWRIGQVQEAVTDAAVTAGVNKIAEWCSGWGFCEACEAAVRISPQKTCPRCGGAMDTDPHPHP